MPAGEAMMADDSQWQLVLQRLPEGGFVVTDGYAPGMLTRPLFASTTIYEALSFMRSKLVAEAK